MRTQITSRSSPRAPDNELYDRGADLVEAAAGIRDAAGSLAAGRAVPAALGCIEAALGELLWAAAALERTTTELATGGPEVCPNPRTMRIAGRMHRGYANLQDALSDAQRAASAARSLAGRALTGANARRR
jgi:hypothetical protein